jgi:outer membrane protein
MRRRRSLAAFLFAATAMMGAGFPLEASAQQPRPPGPPAPPTKQQAPTPLEAPSTEMMAATPGGITADQVAARAAMTSYQAKAAVETLNAAESRTDAARVNYIPRVVFIARYTRLSEFTLPSFTGGGALVGTVQPPGTVNPAPTQAITFSFPQLFDNYLTQATIAIPISDYFLRINQSVTAASRQEEAARYDILTARAKSYSDGKIAYFTWLRARGAIVVAQQSLAVAKAHTKDAENQFAVGNASKADVLRAQTSVAAAELAVERAKSGAIISEAQIRIATHAKPEEKLEPGESLDSAVAPSQQNLQGLLNEANAGRPEIKSIDKNALAARKIADAQSAGRWPVLSGFGDVTYANPNQRRIPQRDEWFPTWALGAQLTWSPNDFITAGAQSADYEARAASLDAQKQAIRDGIQLEVTQAYQQILEADTAMQTTTRQLESAEEGYRVARELFNAGRGTSTTLIDAEQALAQTRFEHLNAKVDARLARIRLDHAVARDVKSPDGAPALK